MFAGTLSSRDGFDLAAAYAVEAELSRQRRAAGHAIVGRKVAFANPAVWAKLKIENNHAQVGGAVRSEVAP